MLLCFFPISIFSPAVFGCQGLKIHIFSHWTVRFGRRGFRTATGRTRGPSFGSMTATTGATRIRARVQRRNAVARFATAVAKDV